MAQPQKKAPIKKKEISNVIKGSDSCDSLARRFITYILDGMNYFEMIDLIKSIDVKDIENAYNSYYKNLKYSYALLKGENND